MLIEPFVLRRNKKEVLTELPEKTITILNNEMNEEQRKEVYNIIKKYDSIKKVTHFNSTPVGYKYQISFSIFVDGNMTTKESHAIADKLEKEISDTLNDIYLTVIHVNPIE